MRITTLSNSRHGWRVMLAAAVVALAACTDNPAAPASKAAVASTANAMILPPPVATLATVLVKDVWGSLIKDGVETQWVDANGTSKLVQDNVAPDLDPTLGIITIKQTSTPTVKVCLTKDTDNHAVDKTQPYCNTVAWSYPTMDMGSLLMRRFPTMTFQTMDLSGKTVVGAKFGVVGQIAYNKQFFDGEPLDQSPGINGKVSFKLDRPGPYWWCEMVAPNGFQSTNPSCGMFTAAWDVDMALPLKHAPVAIRLPD